MIFRTIKNMDPYIKDKNKAMGGTKEAYENFNLPRRLKKEWAELKRKSRRKKRRTDKMDLGKEQDE